MDSERETRLRLSNRSRHQVSNLAYRCLVGLSEYSALDASDIVHRLSGWLGMGSQKVFPICRVCN